MRSVFWEENKVKLVDQRLLPSEFTIVEFDTVDAVANSITEMYVRGAPAIGAAGAYAMVIAARNSGATNRDGLLNDLRTAKSVLDAARPTAVNLSWATARLLDVAENTVLDNLDDIRSMLLAEAEALADEDVEINRRIGYNGAEVVPHGANLLHHCNTGALATVDFGTAIGVIYACHELGKDIHVWVDETRPRLQGARLTAWELMRAEVPMHLIVDSASGHLMRSGQVDVVVFGADRTAANGDVCNKIGTYNLSVCAKENGVPVYAAVPTSTIDLNLATGDEIPIEERDAAEVSQIGLRDIAPENVPVFNPAFDITPHRYITGIITEEGICYPPFTQSLAKAKAKAEARVQENRAKRGEG